MEIVKLRRYRERIGSLQQSPISKSLVPAREVAREREREREVERERFILTAISNTEVS
jgi:hypothetical protein